MSGRRLVALEHGGGVAAVVRDRRGRAWLGDPEPGTLLEDFRPAVQGLEGDVTLAGGLAPTGTARVVVVDRIGAEHDAVCGRGAWLVVLQHPVHGESPAVRFLDAAGKHVAVPLPAGVEVEPVADADEPCPACGAADWARVVAAPPSRYGSDGAGRPTAAVCRRCGHEEHLGVLYGFEDDIVPPDSDAMAELRARHARSSLAMAGSASFVLYGLAGHRPAMGGHGTRDGELTSVTLWFTTRTGDVTVETTTEQPWQSAVESARSALEGLLHERDGDWPRGSPTAICLWLNGRRRAHAADAASAPARELAVPVDGAPTPFATVACGKRFATVARLDGLTVTIAGHGDPAGLALETVPPSAL